MAHHIYSSPGLVLQVRPRGEADMQVWLITYDTGLVRAVAKGLRLSTSKLRMSVAPGSRAIFSLVRGKEMWRLTNALEATHHFPLWQERGEIAYSLAFRIQALCIKLIPEEQINHRIMESLEYLWRTLAVIPLEQFDALESVVLLNVLHELGYVGDVSRWQMIMRDTAEGFDSIDLELFADEVIEARKVINASLVSSHLISS